MTAFEENEMNRKRLLLELFLYAILTIVGLTLFFSRTPVRIIPIMSPIQISQPTSEPEGGISRGAIFDRQSEYWAA